MNEKGYMEGFIKNYRKDLFGDFLAEPVDPDRPYAETIETPGPKKVLNDLRGYLSAESKILDVGCGDGENLILFKQNGFNDLTGLDPIPECCQRLKNFYDIECYDKSLSEFAEIVDKEKKFDCVILDQVIEHFVEPDKALETINNLMADGGVLYIRTPNLYKFNKPLSQFCIPHTFYFSETTLENLLNKYGFKVKSYFDNLKQIPHEMVLLAEKSIEKPKYSADEARKVLIYLKKEKFIYIILKLGRLVEDIFIKVFGENIYLSTRNFFKNCLIKIIKKCRK